MDSLIHGEIGIRHVLLWKHNVRRHQIDMEGVGTTENQALHVTGCATPHLDCRTSVEHRKRYELQDNDDCALCSQEPEAVEHMLLHCPVAREVWWAALNFIRMPHHFQADALDICDTWNRIRAGLPKHQKREWTLSSY